MNLFDLPELMLGVQNLGMIEAQLTTVVRFGAGNRKLEDKTLEKMKSSIKWLRERCVEAGFAESCQKIDLVSYHTQEAFDTDISTVRSELRSISDVILAEGKKHAFLRVMPDRVEYLDNDVLFGGGVNVAFPSAKRDIREAGNCLAAECGTACVFHLMRAAEIALRTLALDRGVAYPDASVNSKQVGDLLSALDGKLLDLRKADAKLWPSRDVKDIQINFYHRALVEFRDFNEAFRKYMAHAHEGAFYDRDQAFSIFKHVKECMIVLSEKLSESATTPLYWTTA